MFISVLYAYTCAHIHEHAYSHTHKNLYIIKIAKDITNSSGAIKKPCLSAYHSLWWVNLFGDNRFK